VEISATSFNGSWLDLLAVQQLQAGYVRFFVKQAQAKTGLYFFVLLENGNSNTDNASIRLRIHDENILLWNVGNTDSASPDVYDPAQRDKSVKLPVGQSTCFEIFYDNTNDLIKFWMNGNAILGMEIDNDPSTGFDQRWLRDHGGFFNIDVRLVRLGWGGNGSNTMLYDDIAVSTSRIGCN